jgi:hypothetical protein
MPTEIRHILFTAAEVVEAAAHYRRLCGAPLPSGTVTEACAIATTPGAPIAFRIVIELDKPDRCGELVTKTKAFDLVGADLAAPLIAYCSKRGIPMPAKGAKSLQRFGSKIGLIISLNGNGEEMLAAIKV